jgi:acyl carrier protein
MDTSRMKSFEDIVVEQLKIPREQVSDSLTPKDVPDWDSMNYLLFIAELEKVYGISFSMDEVLNSASLGDVRTLLKDKGAPV